MIALKFEEYLDQNVPDKITFEGTCLGPEMQNIVAAEDDNKIFGDLKINDWRNCFSKFGLVETWLGSSSSDRAEMVANKFPSGNSCTCFMNGDSLIIYWAGIPMLSVSAWQFKEEKAPGKKHSCHGKRKSLRK